MEWELNPRNSAPGLHIPFFFFFFFSFPFMAAPEAYGSSEARGQIGAAAACLRHSQSNAGSEPCLQPWPKLAATVDP